MSSVAILVDLAEFGHNIHYTDANIAKQQSEQNNCTVTESSQDVSALTLDEARHYDARQDNALLAELVEVITTGDEQALGQLYDLTVNRVYSLAYAMTNNANDAEDIVSDVYWQIWQKASQYNPARGPVIAWLLIHCRSLALDLLRRRRRQQTGQAKLEQQLLTEDTETSIDIGADDLLNLLQEGTAVHKALQQLSEIQQQLIALAFFRDMSHAEIAAAVQLPLGTVKSHIRRGLQILRLHIEL